MSALAESSDISMPYINRAVGRLEKARRALLDKEDRRPRDARLRPDRLRFAPLGFEQKKLVAARFIREIRLEGDSAVVDWNI